MFKFFGILLRAILALFAPTAGARGGKAVEKEAASVIFSQQEEARARSNITKIREGGSKVTQREDGGLGFDKFNTGKKG